MIWTLTKGQKLPRNSTACICTEGLNSRYRTQNSCLIRFREPTCSTFGKGWKRKIIFKSVLGRDMLVPGRVYKGICGSKGSIFRWHLSVKPILHDWSESDKKRIPNNLKMHFIVKLGIILLQTIMNFGKVVSSLWLEWYSMCIFIWFGPGFAQKENIES